MHPNTFCRIAHFKQADLLEEARRDRLANMARTSPGLSLHVRNLLVSARGVVSGAGARLIPAGTGGGSRSGRSIPGLPA